MFKTVSVEDIFMEHATQGQNKQTNLLSSLVLPQAVTQIPSYHIIHIQHAHTMYSGDPLKDSATSLMVRCWAIPKSKTAEEEVSQDGNDHVVWLNVSNPNDSYLQP